MFGGSRMRVEVERERCVHSGYCVELVPDVFELREDGSHVSEAAVPPDREDAVREAELLCPSAAVRTDDGP